MFVEQRYSRMIEHGLRPDPAIESIDGFMGFAGNAPNNKAALRRSSETRQPLAARNCSGSTSQVVHGKAPHAVFGMESIAGVRQARCRRWCLGLASVPKYRRIDDAMKTARASATKMLIVFLVCGTQFACSDDATTSAQNGNEPGGEQDTTPVVDTSGGGTTEPVGGVDVPAAEVSGAVQEQVCDRIVPEEVSPAIDCTPLSIGPDYDGCSGANDACGPVIGCVLGRNESIEENVVVTYSGPVEGFQPPATHLPAMGTYMDGWGTGWFGRGDGTTATGSCSLPPVRNIMAAALTSIQFGNADWCGACAEVVGSSGQRVRVQLVDQCTGCSEFSLDLGAGDDSPYELLDIQQNHDVCLPIGGQPLRWRIVPCETAGGVVVHYVPGFNRYTPAIQIRNHRLPIVKVEDFVEGVWAEVPREANNWYYVRSVGDGAARPIALRITAIDGSTIEGEFPAYEEDRDFEATAQF